MEKVSKNVLNYWIGIWWVLCEVEKHVQEIIINVVEDQTTSIKSKEFEGTFGEEKAQQDVNDIVPYAGHL